MTSWQHCGCPQPRSQEQHANVADWHIPQQRAAPLYDLHEQLKLHCQGDSLLRIPLAYWGTYPMKLQLRLVICRSVESFPARMSACNKTYEHVMPAKLVSRAMSAVALPQFQPLLPKRPVLRPACPLNSHLTAPIPDIDITSLLQEIMRCNQWHVREGAVCL